MHDKASYTQLSPILPNVDSAKWSAQLEGPLPPHRTIGQTPAPENNHWLNVGDRFIFLGGDNEDFKSYVVEASHRVALIPFEAKATYRPVTAIGEEETAAEYWFPYVEAARVFVDPGKPWFEILSPFQSMVEARELGVPRRRWLFLDGRDQATRELPTDLARRKALQFTKVLLDRAAPDAPGEQWEVKWEMMVGTADRMDARGRGWNWKEDLRYGFIWPPPERQSTTGSSSPYPRRPLFVG